MQEEFHLRRYLALYERDPGDLDNPLLPILAKLERHKHLRSRQGPCAAAADRSAASTAQFQ